MTDERKGKPSASSALFDQLCPGRWKAQQEWLEVAEEIIPEFEPENDDDAAAGIRVHKIYAGQDCPEATEAERRRAEMAKAADDYMRQQWLRHFQHEPESPITEIRENRWWLRNEAGQEIYSGQSDAVWIRGEFGGIADILLADLKGLWGYHDAAPLNVQIRRYVALIAVNIEELGFTQLRSAMAYMNQPAKTLKPMPVLFEEAEIKMAIDEMHVDLAEMVAPDALRIPGPRQCAKCRASLICAEYGQFIAQELSAVPKLGAPMPSKEAIESAVSGLDGFRLATLLEWLPALENATTIARTEAKRRLRKDAESVPGWGLKNNSPRSKITDIKTLYKRFLATFQVEADEFLGLCSISKENTERLLREKSHLTGQARAERLKILLEGTTMPIPVSPSLEKK